MGVINGKTGEVIIPNRKSETHGVVEALKVEQNEQGENTLKMEIRMNDL